MRVAEWEFRFQNGTMESYQVQEGRDTVAIDAHAIRLELHPAPTLTESIVVVQAALASWRTVRSEVEDEAPAVVEAGGTVRVSRVRTAHTPARDQGLP